MGLRDRLVELAESRARGRVTVDDSGRSTYHPPGSRVRYVADWVAFVGTIGYVLPLAGAFSLVTSGYAGYPELYPGVHPRVNLAVIVGVPLLAAPLVWVAVMCSGWKPRAGATAIGLAGTVLTWRITRQVFAWAAAGAGPPPIFALSGLAVGSVLVLVGGLLATAAVLFGEWTRQFDTQPAIVHNEGWR